MNKWITKISKVFSYWKQNGLVAVSRKLYTRSVLPQWVGKWQYHPFFRWLRAHALPRVYTYWQSQQAALSKTPQETSPWKPLPLVDVILLGNHPTLIHQSQTSLEQQPDSRWTLHHLACQADSLRELPSENSQGRVQDNENFLISQFNALLPDLKGEWLLFMLAGDRLAPQALHEVKVALQEDTVDWLYTDHDFFAESGQLESPQFKPDWSPWYLLSHNYIGNLCVFRKNLIQELGGLSQQFSGAFYDLLLRAGERVAPERIAHIPQVLYHCWVGQGGELAKIFYGRGNQQECVKAALQRRQLEASVMVSRLSTLQSPPQFLHFSQPMILPQQPAIESVHRVRPNLKTLPLISILIPFRDLFPVLERAVISILERSTYRNFEILLIDNQSTSETRHQVEALLQKDARLRLLHYPHPFNYSAINNFAVNHTEGEVLVLLNNDMEVLTPEWLEWMWAYAQFPQHGAVGVKLYYPNGLIQHGGIVTGLFDVAGHVHRFADPRNPGNGLCLACIREVSAVTAACLMVRKHVYEQVGGLDETLKVAFNDVDFCLRLQQQGFTNLFLPTVELIHYESLSRGKDESLEQQQRVRQEIDTLQQRWGRRLQRDPFYNPNLAVDAEDCFFRIPPLPSTELRP